MCDVSDHFPVFQFIHSSSPRSNDHKDEPIKHRKFSRNNMENFKSAISSITWDEVLMTKEVNKAYELFLKSFNKALDESFSLVSNTCRNKSSRGKPWTTEELKKVSRKKNELYRRSILNPSLINTETYNKCKNQFTALVRKIKKTYYSNQFAQASRNIKKKHGTSLITY